jgi:tetratricopeptide (TPR) repeat protein
MPDAVDRGIALLRNAARSRPDDPKICIDLMAAWCRKDQPQEAVSEFVAFVKHCSEATQLHHDVLLELSRGQGLANSLFQGFQQAAQQARSADTFLIHYAFGLLYATLGMHDQAIPAYEESIRLNPNYGPAYHNLGLSCHYSGRLLDDSERQRRTTKALDACRTAIRKSATLAEAHYFLGVIEMNRDPAMALSHLVEFVRLAKPYLANHIPGAEVTIQLLKEKLGYSEGTHRFQ